MGKGRKKKERGNPGIPSPYKKNCPSKNVYTSHVKKKMGKQLIFKLSEYEKGYYYS